MQEKSSVKNRNSSVKCRVQTTDKSRVGQSHFRSFALSLFALLLFLKREPRSDSLFRSFLKECKRAIRSFAILKRAKKSESLFCSFGKERQRAIRSFALYQKSVRAHKRANRFFFAFFITFSLFLKSGRSLITLFKEKFKRN